jgi:uncharacterized BrkB/YihY/UPF0761 family membrane protein
VVIKNLQQSTEECYCISNDQKKIVGTNFRFDFFCLTLTFPFVVVVIVVVVTLDNAGQLNVGFSWFLGEMEGRRIESRHFVSFHST